MKLINSLSDLIHEIMVKFIITVLSLQNVLSEPVPDLGGGETSGAPAPGSAPIMAPQSCKLKSYISVPQKKLQIYKQKKKKVK